MRSLHKALGVRIKDDGKFDFTNKDEFEYPLYFRNKFDNHIVKFISLEEGIVITIGDTFNQSLQVGVTINHWVPHTDTDEWEPIAYYIGVDKWK